MKRITLVPALTVAVLIVFMFALRPTVDAQVGSAPAVNSQDEHANHHPGAPESAAQDTMKMREQMMSEMKAADARLDALVKAMNDATGAAKVDAVAAVVNELVQQHKAMRGRMGQMGDRMMGRGMMRPR